MRENDAILPTSPGRINAAIKRLNRRALDLTRPGPNWLLTSVKIGLAAKAASVLLGVAVLALYYLLDEEPSPLISRSLVELVVLALVLAPVIETLQIMLVHAATRRWIGLSGFVAASTILAYLLHSPANVMPIVAAFVFLVMSYQYVSFRERLGTGKAFAGVAVTHAVVNSVAVLVVLVERMVEA